MSTTNRQTSEQTKKQPKSNAKVNQTPQPANVSPLAGLPLSAAIDNPDLAPSDSIVRLQRAAGNRAVNNLLENRSSNRPQNVGAVQFKLTVGPASDKYEQEADQVADRILRMPAPTQSAAPAFTSDPIQRDFGLEEEKEPEVQRQFELHNQAAGAGDEGGNDGSNGSDGGGLPASDPPPIIHRFASTAQRQSESPADPMAGFETDATVEREINSRAGSGKPLAESTRSFMEPRFGADLSSVRVHTGPSADQLNRKLSAQAFTHGPDIYFGSGKYNPGTTSGDRLLAHELTHVVQQGAAAPVRRKYQSASGNRNLVQRALTAETTRAFDSAATANPQYEHGRKLVNKYGDPENEPDPSQPPPPAPWQTRVTTEMTDDNVTSGEQDQINKVGRTHGLMFWKKSDEQEKKLKDFVRAFMLWDFASRTNQLRPDDKAKYGKLPAPKKLEKRKAYMSHAKPFQEKFKGLVEKGPSAPETQAFLQQEKFLDSMAITDKQQEKAKALGPRIDVRSTFIGGPILGIHLRAHLFIVYTGRDGKQFYFRGGPGENLDPNDPTTDGYTTADYGEYSANTIDYDPSAPSVTVMQGEAAEAKLDMMIEAAKAVNSMRVPYQAQIETETQKKFRKSKFANKFKTAGDFIGEALGIFGTKGENCNRAAYTILARAGVPTDKPMGKHPGWGAILGADTPGKENAMPKAEADDPSGATKYTLDAKHDITGSDGTIQVYLDRMFFQKSDTLADGTEVEQLADEASYRKIKYGDGKVGYIAKHTKDAKRSLKMKLKAALIARNWYVADELDDMGDEIGRNDFGRVLTLLQDVNQDRDFDSIEKLIEALGSLIADFGKPGNKLFKKKLDGMSEAEIRNLKHDYTEMRALIDETGAEIGEAIKMVEARIGEMDRRDKVMMAIGEMLVDNLQINLWVNHYPNYSTIHEIAKNANDDFGYVLDTLDSMRSNEVKGHFIEEIFDQLSYEKLKTIVTDPEGNAAVVTKCSEWLGVPEQFFLRRVTERYEKKKEKRKLAKEQEELRQSELAKLNKGYTAKDYPGGKHKWQLTEPTEVTVAATLEGPANIKYLVDPKVMMPRVAVSDEWTTQYGRGRLEHNGKSYYIDLATVFGPPKSAKKKEEEPKSTSPFEGLLTPPKDKPIDFFEFSGTSEIDEPTRIKIIDEDYKDRDEWAHTFIMIGARRAGNVYAGDLVKYFKSDAEASGGGGDKADESDVDTGKADKVKPPLTEHFKAGKYPWPWEEAITIHVSATKDGPLDTERTFQPNGKYMQVSIFDDMTLQYGRCILWHNGGMFYVSLEEAFGLPEEEVDVEEVLDESVVADTPVKDEEPDLDDQLEDDEDSEPPMEDNEPEEETDELPFASHIISAFESGADLDMLYQQGQIFPDELKKLNAKQLEKLAKHLGVSVERGKQDIEDLR